MTSDLSWLTKRPIAHRGLHDREHGIVENTAGAFSAAMAKSFAIECDLQLTRDGDAVVFHDDSLERLTEATGTVIALTAAEMQRLTIRGSMDRVQTLEQLLLQVSRKVPLVIELKSHWDGSERLVQRVVDVMARYRGPYALMSFDPDIVAAIRRLAPHTLRGIVADRATDPYYDKLGLSRARELRTLSHLARTRPHFLSFYFRDLPWAPIHAYRAAGYPVISWTIRTAEEASEALLHSDQITFESFAPEC